MPGSPTRMAAKGVEMTPPPELAEHADSVLSSERVWTPHSASTFPDSRQWVEKKFAGEPDAVRRRIVQENAVELYGMSLPPP